MLSNIYIENVAVIEKASIDFDTAFNVLTGETGAGKSIIIDSINAVMGQRVSRDLIRSGASSAFVSATFTEVSDKICSIFAELGYDAEDSSFILQRQITSAGKNVCKINGRPAPLSVLKKASAHLINIYGQHEGYDFMTVESHISYIDALGDYDVQLDDYRQKFEKYSELRKKLTSAKDDIQDRERKIDLLQYQINEIEEADLQSGEIEELESRRTMLLNSEKIKNGIAYAYSELIGDDEEGILSRLDTVSDNLNEIAELYPDISELAQRVQSAYLELQDCNYELRDTIDDVDMDPEELEEIEERLDLIRSLCRKYGNSVEEIVDFCFSAKKQLNELIEFDINKEKLEKQYAEALKAVKMSAKELSKRRTECAKTFANDVIKEMRYLDMPNVIMVPSITACEFNEYGCDNLELLISANPGEEPKPISKIASGGELSRIMLAIKSIIADKDGIGTLIFDEVDAGISGSAASKVGRKLMELSQNHQVLCVTHQAQIAALADAHLFISKSVSDGRTFTKVRELNFDERKYELSRIIDGDNPSELALQHAEEMLKLSPQNKS
ncbi:MAG: DNA repair protein RecN [Lachnospiraceae bacterium]|nr:DNA repair protein RecN [Lachnospiraceae bacterium]